MNILEWITDHYMEILAALGLGAGGTYGGKKLISSIDKRQNKELKNLSERVDSVEGKMTKIEGDVKTNTLFDKQLRSDLKEQREILRKRLDKIEVSQEKILFQLIELNKK